MTDADLETRRRLDELRAKALAGTLTDEEAAEGFEAIRQRREAAIAGEQPELHASPRRRRRACWAAAA